MSSLRRLTLAALAALAVAVPTASRADTYIELKGGVYVPTAGEAISSIGGLVNSGTMPTGGDIELALGWKAGILGLQLSAGYLWSSNDTLQSSGIPFTGVVQLRFPILFVQPYLEAGIGGFVNTAKAKGLDVSETKVSFAAVGGGGVDLVFGPLLVGAEARYLYVSPTDFSFGTLKASGVLVTANLGYIF